MPGLYDDPKTRKEVQIGVSVGLCVVEDVDEGSAQVQSWVRVTQGKQLTSRAAQKI